MPSMIVCMAVNKAFQSGKVQNLISDATGRYARIISFEARRDGYHASVQLLGSSEVLEVTVREIRASGDKQHFSLHGFETNQIWLTHVLEDHVEGREFPLPDLPGLGTVIGML